MNTQYGTGKPFKFKEMLQDNAWNFLPKYTKRYVITIYTQLLDEYQKITDKNSPEYQYIIGKIEMLNNLFGSNITELNSKDISVFELIKDFIDDHTADFTAKQFESKFKVDDIVFPVDIYGSPCADSYKITKLYFDDYS